MRASIRTGLYLCATLWLAAPAFAGGKGGATPVPEPADAGLFLLGVAGFLIGRRIRSPRR